MTVFFSTTPNPTKGRRGHAGCSLLFGQTTSTSSSVANEGFAPLCGAAATPVAALKSSVANEGFAPLGGAAATPVAALKTPVAPVTSPAWEAPETAVNVPNRNNIKNCFMWKN